MHRPLAPRFVATPMVRHLAPLALLLSAAGVGAAPVGSADPLAEVDDEDSRPQASRSGCCC